MTAIESKEEISDTDSGIILHSGKDKTEEMSNQLSHFCTLVLHNQYQNIDMLLHTADGI